MADTTKDVLVGVAILGGGILLMQGLAVKMGANLGNGLRKAGEEAASDIADGVNDAAQEWERRNVNYFSPSEYVVNNAPPYVPGVAVWTAQKPAYWSIIRPPGYTVEYRDSQFQKDIKTALNNTPGEMMKLPPWNVISGAASLLDNLLGKIMPTANAVKTDNSALIFEPGTGYPAVADDRKYLRFTDLFKTSLNYEGYLKNPELDHDIARNPSNYERVGQSDALNKTTGVIETISQATKGETNQIPGFNQPMDGGIEIPVEDKGTYQGQYAVYNAPKPTPPRMVKDANGNMIAVQ